MTRKKDEKKEIFKKKKKSGEDRDKKKKNIWLHIIYLFYFSIYLFFYSFYLLLFIIICCQMDYDHKKLRSICLPKNKFTTTKSTIFSDEEDDDDNLNNKTVIPSLQSYNATFSSTQYIDPVYISSSYHIHQAEMALFNLKTLLNERTDSKEGWKKALKHKKSGVCVYMKSSSSNNNNHHQHYNNNNLYFHSSSSSNPFTYSTINSSSSASCLLNDKIPIFKGEAIFKGFTPHSIFYVIGMRKLWDDQYEDGNLVENLNDTTSLTYEVWKSNNSSK